jgi:hypothetical protein
MFSFGPYTPSMWGLSKSERRRGGAEILYELETAFRENSWPSDDFLYDAEHDLYMRLEAIASIGIGVWLGLRQYQDPSRPWYQRWLSR